MGIWGRGMPILLNIFQGSRGFLGGVSWDLNPSLLPMGGGGRWGAHWSLKTCFFFL